MRSLIVLLALVGSALADITGTNPAAGTCLCADGSSINVRATACGSVIGSISTGDCYKYSGSKSTCTLSGVQYEYFKIEYGSGGWVAGDYLVTASASSCESAGGCPHIVTRAEWGARPPTSITYINQPVPRIFVHHTETASCYTQADCSAIVRSIQNYHMDSNGWSDIGYNFLIGEDGNAYEGRGWDRVGAHVSDYNSVSMGYSMIGSFMTRVPNAAAMTALTQLVNCAPDNGVSSAYSLHGHRDGGCTDCPGDALYSEIITWPHYGGVLPGSCKRV